MEELEGIVEKIRFHNPENGWTVLELLNLKTKKRITVTLSQVGVVTGSSLALTGSWANDQKFGLQFKAKSYRVSKPSTTHGIEKYLASGLFGHIGEAWARKITEAFGSETLEILDKTPERLLEIKFNPKHLDTFKREWYEANIGREVIVFLEGLGLTFAQSQKAFNELGDSTITLVKEDPYVLSQEVSHIGFKTADRIAIQLGMPLDDHKRLFSGINYIYKEIHSEGHSYLTREQLIQIIKDTLNLNAKHEEKINQTIDVLIELKVLVQEEDALYLNSIYQIETAIVKKIKLLKAQTVEDGDNWAGKIEAQALQQKLNLSSEQKQAVATIIQSPVAVLTGGAGVGKTTTVKFLLQILHNMNKVILLGAPTGRAAQRMSEVINQPAQTLHRLLKWSAEERMFIHNSENPLKADFIVVDEVSMVDAPLMNSLLEAISPGTQLLIIGDPNQLPSVGMGAILESMIDSGVIPVCALTQIFRQEVESSIVKYSYEVMSGTVPAIPSPVVQPELLDEKRDALFIDSELATPEEKKFISKYAKQIKEKSRAGEKRNFTEREKQGYLDIPSVKKFISKSPASAQEQEELEKIITQIKPYSSLLEGMDAEEAVLAWYEQIVPHFYNIKNIQILSPMKKYSLGTRNLNSKLQNHLNPPGESKPELKFGDTIFRENDKVIQLKNDYQKMIFNGDIGYIDEVDETRKKLSVKFDSQTNPVWLERDELEHLDLAYVITIHKSQGSEFEAVIIPISPQHLHMLNRNLIYTAMTRGKKLVIFVGSRSALAAGVQKSEKSTRQTKLVKLLQKG